MFDLVKTIEVNTALLAIEKLQVDITNFTYTARRFRESYLSAKLKACRAKRRLAAATCVTPGFWDYTKICPDKDIAERLRNHRDHFVSELRDLANRLERSIVDYHDRYNEAEQNLARAKFKHANLQLAAHNLRIFKLEDWEHELRLNSLYQKGSLKLREHAYRSNLYKVTATFSPTVAHSTETYDNYPDIHIPRIIADFTIDKKYNSTSVSFRAASGSKRYRGFEARMVLHPHMTDSTTPCLGDFGGPIYEALNDFDIPTAVTILAMFLESYDPTDGAGRYYHQWPSVESVEEAA